MLATNGADASSRVVGPTRPASAQARACCFYVGGVGSGIGMRPTLADVPGAVRVSLGWLLATSSSAICFQRSSPTWTRFSVAGSCRYVGVLGSWRR